MMSHTTALKWQLFIWHSSWFKVSIENNFLVSPKIEQSKKKTATPSAETSTSAQQCHHDTNDYLFISNAKEIFPMYPAVFITKSFLKTILCSQSCIPRFSSTLKKKESLKLYIKIISKMYVRGKIIWALQKVHHFATYIRLILL